MTIDEQGISQYQTALYIHLPFCRSKCYYCDFVSYIDQGAKIMESYCQDIQQEMDLLAARYQPGPLGTVYMGGGTPTLLPAGKLVRLLKAAAGSFGKRSQAEISVEANPGTVDFEQYRFLRAAGVNRLSLGVQAFDDLLLKNMGRIHNKQENYRSYDLARQGGFTNINLDLIFGLPGQTQAQWKATIKEALALQPEHISAYGLQIEAGTLWGRLQAAGKLFPPEEELPLTMYQMVREELAKAGYEHYEISNFARPGYKCRHNLCYWLNYPYLGVGAAAASSWQGSRWRNYSSLKEYNITLATGELPIAESEQLNLRLQMAETMFMGLRLTAGVDLNAFRKRFNADARIVYASEMERLFEWGLAEIQAGHFRLTEKGLPLANEVFMQFV